MSAYDYTSAYHSIYVTHRDVDNLISSAQKSSRECQGTTDFHDYKDFFRLKRKDAGWQMGK